MSGISIESLAASLAERRVSERFSPPSFMELFLTEGCNLACTYCFVKEKTGRQMTPETARRAVDMLMEVSRDEKRVSILYFGGEPLTRFDLIVDVTSYANEVAEKYGKTVDYSMTTNGTIADPHKLRYCRAHGIKYLISVDGTKATHDACRKTVGGNGSYDRIIANLPAFKAHQPWVGVRYTVAPLAAPSILEGVARLFARGVNQFIMGPAHGVEWTSTDVRAYRDSLFELADWYVEKRLAKAPLRISYFESKEGLGSSWGCGAGRGRISVSAGGVLYGCSKLVTVNGLRSEGLFRLGSAADGITNWRARSDLTDGTDRKRHACRRCALREQCTGGCPAVNFESTGDPFIPDPVFCEFTALALEVQQYVSERMDA